MEPANREKTDTKFQPGQSGNPNGRPKSDPEVMKYLKEHTMEAAQKKVALMRHPDTKPDLVNLIAEQILDRTMGKPIQNLDVTSDGSPIVFPIDFKDFDA
jgi:hypothetical protein